MLIYEVVNHLYLIFLSVFLVQYSRVILYLTKGTDQKVNVWQLIYKISVITEFRVRCKNYMCD